MRVALGLLLATACHEPPAAPSTRGSPIGSQCPSRPAELATGTMWTPVTTLRSTTKHDTGPSRTVYQDGTTISVRSTLMPRSPVDAWPAVCSTRISMCSLAALETALRSESPPRGESMSIGIAIDHQTGAEHVWSRPPGPDAPPLVAASESVLSSCAHDGSGVLLAHRSQGALVVVLENGQIERRSADGVRSTKLGGSDLASLISAVSTIRPCMEPQCVIGDPNAGYVEHIRAGEHLIAYTASNDDVEAVQRLRLLSCTLADRAFPGSPSSCFPG